MVDYNWKKVFDVEVDASGRVSWVPSGEFLFTCNLDMTYFPFDIQTCTVTWSVLQSDSHQVELKTGKACQSEYDRFLLSPNGAWHVHEVYSNDSYSSSTIAETNVTYEYGNVHFTIYLSRKPEYYLLFVVSPIATLSVLGLVQFLVPPGDGEKVTSGITVMLSCFVFLTSVGDNIPETSESIPLIGEL